MLEQSHSQDVIESVYNDRMDISLSDSPKDDA